MEGIGEEKLYSPFLKSVKIKKPHLVEVSQLILLPIVAWVANNTPHFHVKQNMYHFTADRFSNDDDKFKTWQWADSIECDKHLFQQRGRFMLSHVFSFWKILFFIWWAKDLTEEEPQYNKWQLACVIKKLSRLV